MEVIDFNVANKIRITLVANKINKGKECCRVDTKLFYKICRMFYASQWLRKALGIFNAKVYLQNQVRESRLA